MQNDRSYHRADSLKDLSSYACIYSKNRPDGTEMHVSSRLIRPISLFKPPKMPRVSSTNVPNQIQILKPEIFETLKTNIRV